MIKKTKILAIVLLVLIAFQSSVVLASENENTKNKQDFKVVGYYTASSFDEPIERLQLDKLTHVMYGFIKPTKEGELLPVPKPEKLTELVSKAHDKNVKVFIAIGGWGYQNNPLAPTFEAMANDETARKSFINNTVEFVKHYKLDGAEIDWEYPQKATGEAYEVLITELAIALHNIDKELSAAVAGATSVNDKPETSRMISQKALEALDFIEIMVYDLAGENHSPLWYAKQSFLYWNSYGMPQEKIIIGMPLYARPSWVQYRNLVKYNPEYAYLNYAEAGTVSKLASTYNGLPLLHDKVVFALQKNAGGIMLFDINEDTNDEYSVLSMIDKLLQIRNDLSRNDFEHMVWVYINNHPLEFSHSNDLGVPHIDENGRTLIPLRKSLECVGATVDYQAIGQIITIAKDDVTIQLSIGSKTVYINDTAVEMDTNAVLINNRTYIPARVVFEALGYNVFWQQIGRSAYINN